MQWKAEERAELTWLRDKKFRTNQHRQGSGNLWLFSEWPAKSAMQNAGLKHGWDANLL